MIQIKDVTKLYPAKAAGNGPTSTKGGDKGGTLGRDNGAIHALDHISLHVAKGEWLSIMGPSGSGKSTLVNRLPGSSHLGRNLAGWEKCRWDFRRRIEPGASGENRIHLSAISPDSISYRGRERHAGSVFPQYDRRKRGD
jgi:ABC-type polysaccharide/polyol phosphate transport system ATPase subunit